MPRKSCGTILQIALAWGISLDLPPQTGKQNAHHHSFCTSNSLVSSHHSHDNEYFFEVTSAMDLGPNYIILSMLKHLSVACAGGEQKIGSKHYNYIIADRDILKLPVYLGVL